MIKEALFISCAIVLIFGFNYNIPKTNEASQCRNYELFPNMFKSNTDPYEIINISIELELIPKYQSYYTKYVYKDDLGIDLCKQWLPLPIDPIYVTCNRVNETKFECSPYTTLNLVFDFNIACENIEGSSFFQHCVLNLNLNILDSEYTESYLSYRNIVSNLRISFLYLVSLIVTYIVSNNDRHINTCLLIFKVLRVAFVISHYTSLKLHSNTIETMVMYNVLLFVLDIVDFIPFTKKTRTE